MRENSYKYEISSISKPITNASVSDYWKGYGKLYDDIQYTCQTATDEPLSSSFKTFWHLFGHNIELPLHDIYHKQDFLPISTRQSTWTFIGIFISRVTKWVFVEPMLDLFWVLVGCTRAICCDRVGPMLGIYRVYHTVYAESILSLYRVYVGSMLGLCSIYFETKSKDFVYWFYRGSIAGPNIYVGSILGPCKVHTDYALATLWAYVTYWLCGSIFGPCSQFWVPLSSMLVHVGSMLCQCWVNVGFISGREQFDDSFWFRNLSVVFLIVKI